MGVVDSHCLILLLNCGLFLMSCFLFVHLFASLFKFKLHLRSQLMLVISS